MHVRRSSDLSRPGSRSSPTIPAQRGCSTTIDASGYTTVGKAARPASAMTASSIRSSKRPSTDTTWSGASVLSWQPATSRQRDTIDQGELPFSVAAVVVAFALGRPRRHRLTTEPRKGTRRDRTSTLRDILAVDVRGAGGVLQTALSTRRRSAALSPNSPSEIRWNQIPSSTGLFPVDETSALLRSAVL